MTEQSPNRPANSLRPTRARHAVLLLVVAAYVITYMDRVNISSAMPVIQRDLGLTAITVGWISVHFAGDMLFFKSPRVVWRQVWAAARSRVGRMLVVGLYLVDRALLERQFHVRLPVLFGVEKPEPSPLQPDHSRAGCPRTNVVSHRDCRTRPLD